MGIDNLENDPLFEDEGDGDLHLQNQSPCIDADENESTQLGAYGNGVSKIGPNGGEE